MLRGKRPAAWQARLHFSPPNLGESMLVKRPPPSPGEAMPAKGPPPSPGEAMLVKGPLPMPGEGMPVKGPPPMHGDAIPAKGPPPNLVEAGPAFPSYAVKTPHMHGVPTTKQQALKHLLLWSSCRRLLLHDTSDTGTRRNTKLLLRP